MRRFAAPLMLFALLGAAGPPLKTVPPVSILANDSEARWVPFDLTEGNQIRFTMTIDGNPATAILDTGVSYSVMSRRYAAATGERIVEHGAADAIGGRVPLAWAATRTLSLGGVTRTGGRIAVVDLPAIATGETTPVDLLVGRDLIGGYALDLDYDARRFRLLTSGRLPFTGVTAPLVISPTRQVYESEITLGGRRIRPMIVDTGDGSAITLSADAWQTLAGPRHAMTSAISFGIGGAIVTDLAVVPELRLGDLTAGEVEVRIERAKGFSQGVGAAGRIGASFLQRYRVLLDPGAGRMVLAPGRTAAAPPLKSTSGLLVRANGRQLDVLHVMRNSPAAAAGWRGGEAICSVDGTAIPADYRRSTIASWSVGRPGRTVALGLCNGPTRRLTLARFY
ncbi:aspartyl protease family protein [Hephaestia sp. GCM10023244]|uniref:aspartyl protease family protein n=1 Tax=unclassified Hephaestia TaxID=2631281 RepID=UPI0020778E07|nr:aspartyl protease family protein [Hephaestia sp. MAHUQ-44]MCM8729529.1 aspartyl protease family protein [Hephaestia sp. MAHUQ-44]